MNDEREQTPLAQESNQPDGRFLMRNGNVTRRQFVGLSASAFVAVVLAACGANATPTSAPAAPTTAATTAPTKAAAGGTTPAATAAAGGAASPAASPTTGAQATTAPPAGKKGGEFHSAWPYEVPPNGHFNTMNGIPKGILVGGPYQDVIEMPLGMYFWKDQKWMPLLATEWKFEGTDTFRVTLRQGVKWSDGKPFTSKDIVTTFWCLRIMRQPVWNFIDGVKADGDYAVTFHMSKPSTVVERYVIRERMRSDATFGEWAKKAEALYAAGKTIDDPEGKQLNQDFQQFRPKEVIVTGPFNFDYKSITNAQLTLVKNPTSWIANQVAFDKIVNFNGETPTITPVVLAKDVDYATHGFPPATEQAFKQAGIRIMRPPVYSGPALFFNFDKLGAVFGDKKVRQALAMAVNRDQNGTVALGDSGKGVKYMTGMSDTLVPQWLSQGDVGKLNTYAYDPQKAEQQLTALGWKKGGDGVWTTKDGTRTEYELSVPAEFADWSASAQNLAEQLTKFGIKTTVRAVTFTQQPIDVDKGNFQLAIQAWGNSTNPHPQFSYDTDLLLHNTRAANQGGKGMAFDLKQQTDSVGAVDLNQLVIDAGLGLDVAQQKANVTKIALAFNELLPIVPLFERYGNNAVLEKVRVAGWPADSDPIVANSLYADNFVVMMILEGKLGPV